MQKIKTLIHKWHGLALDLRHAEPLDSLKLGYREGLFFFMVYMESRHF